MGRDREQTESAAKAEAKFNKLKQQARTRINALSKEIDALKLGQGANGETSSNTEVTILIIRYVPYQSVHYILFVRGWMSLSLAVLPPLALGPLTDCSTR